MRVNKKTKLALVTLSLSILSATVQADEDLITKITSVFLKAFLLMVKGVMYGLMWMIKRNPQIYCSPPDVAGGCVVTAGVDQLTPYFLDLLVPLYIIAFLFTAAFFLVKSTNPRGRARAKMMLFKLLYSMLLVAFAPIIFQLLLDFQAMITEMILDEGLSPTDFEKIGQDWSAASFGGACCLMFIVFKLWYLAIGVGVLRYLLVILFAVMFPIFLFLYMFDLTRGWGRKYIKRALTWIFTPVIQAIFLVVAVRSLDSLDTVWSDIATGGAAAEFEFFANYLPILSPLLGILLVATSMMLFLIAPLITNKLLSYIGGGINAWGIATQSMPVATLGAVLSGRGPMGVASASGIATRAGYYGLSKSLIEGGVGEHSSLGMGGYATGGQVFGAGGGTSGGSLGGQPATKRGESGAGKGESAKDAASRVADAETGAGTGPTRGRDVRDEMYRQTPQDLRTDEGHRAPGQTESATGASPPTTASGTHRATARAPTSSTPSTPSLTPGSTAVSYSAGATPSHAQMRPIADALAEGNQINEEEEKKLRSYVNNYERELMALAADDDGKSLIQQLKKKRREEMVQAKVRMEEGKQHGLRERIARVKMGNYLKRFMKQQQESKGK